MTLSLGFGPNPADFLSCEESCRGQPGFLHEQPLFAIQHHAQTMLNNNNRARACNKAWIGCFRPSERRSC